MINHYTTYKAFKNIIKESVIYLNCVQNMNDRLEIKLFIDDVYDKIFADQLNIHKKNVYHNFFKDFENLDKSYNCRLPSENSNSINEPQYFSLSFSKEYDRAVHWLVYGGRGKGICISVDQEYLENQIRRIKANDEHIHIYLQDISYKNDDNYNKVIDEMCKKIDEALFENDFPDGNIWYDVLDDLLTKCQFIKNDEFSFEKEIRLSIKCFIDCIKRKSDILEYKTINKQFSRFLLKIPKQGFIKKIIIGPKSKIKISTIEKFLKSQGFSNILVEKSKSALK